MQTPVADPEIEVRRLKALIAGFVERTKRVLPSSGSDPRVEILELHHWSAYVQREVQLPPAPQGMCWLNDGRVVHSVMSVEARPH